MDRGRLAMAQGSYYALSGLWPLLHFPSFARATGGKRASERWLVHTVGVLVTAIGGALVSAGRRREAEGPIRVLGIASAIGLAGVDGWYVARRRIAPIYLLDAMAELGIAAAWAAPPARTAGNP